ncbi:Uncharacterized protein PECH_000204 [Penicillium ucsense]|uniref:Uncharacterized protein n=1 Tax=Penicillium ucsense TaxID=2839758 RepID=A0A8J8W8U7_9EURO|nr:Uncharacterized protein PECM_008531 [Penicillium ucsense]KAF7738487.1 Uncharacterized protein PECH_000204 [Penicillium ucsense]
MSFIEHQTETMSTTVSTVLFNLDPISVIREKDRQTLSCQMSSAMPHGPGPESEKQVDKETLITEVEKPPASNCQNTDQMPHRQDPNLPSCHDVEDDSLTTIHTRNTDAALKPAPGSTAPLMRAFKEDVNPALPQVTGDSVSANSQRTSGAALQAQSGLRTNRPYNRKIRRLILRMSQSSRQVQTDSARSNACIHQKSMSRPGHEVDWNEDLRPTDDDESREDHKEAPRQEISLQRGPQKSTIRKRCAPNVQPGQKKRPRNKTQSGSPKATRGSSFVFRSNGSSENGKVAHAALELQEEQLRGAFTSESIANLVASFPVLVPDENSHRVRSEPADPVRRSSNCSVLSSPSDPGGGDWVLERAQKTEGPRLHGPGSAVGQKLKDAICQAQSLQLQHPISVLQTESLDQPVVEQSLRTGAVPQGQVATYQKLSSWSTENSASSSNSEHSVTCKQDKISAYHRSSHKHVSTATLNSSSLSPILRRPRDTAGNEGELEQKLEGKGAIQSKATPNDCLDMTDVSCKLIARPAEFSRRVPSKQHPEPASASRIMPCALTQSTSFKLPGRPQSTIALTSDRGTISKSQQSLLVGTYCQSTRAIAVKSIVDHNGSPRIRPQERTEAALGSQEIAPIQVASMRVSDSSSNARDSAKKSDCYDLDSADHPRRISSKFHRDMFMEYGFDPTELTPGSKESGWTDVDAQKERYSSERSTQKDDSNDDEYDEQEALLLRDAPVLKLSPDKDSEDTHKRGTSLMTQGFTCHRDSPLIGVTHSASGQTTRKVLHSGTDWVLKLQAAQENAQSLLSETNRQLATQLATEHETMQSVLQGYRQGCQQILNDLARAQQARIEIMQQQVSRINEQHAQICRDLRQDLEELDCRLLQNTSSKGGNRVS